MKVMERNVMRLVAVQHLRTAHGIKTKNWNKNKAASCKSTASNSVSFMKTNHHSQVWSDCIAFTLTWNEPLGVTICFSRNQQEYQPWTYYCLVWITLAYPWKPEPSDETHLFECCCHPCQSLQTLCLVVPVIIHTINFFTSHRKPNSNKGSVFPEIFMALCYDLIGHIGNIIEPLRVCTVLNLHRQLIWSKVVFLNTFVSQVCNCPQVEVIFIFIVWNHDIWMQPLLLVQP